MLLYHLQVVITNVTFRSESKVIDTLPSCLLISSPQTGNVDIDIPPSGSVVTVVHAAHTSFFSHENNRTIPINNNNFFISFYVK